MNYCKECITKKPKQTVEECPECKQNTLLVENGSAKCNNCGYGWASTPEFAKCVIKNKYTISVDKSDISHYLLISRLFCINVNAVKKSFDNGETISLNGYTYEIRKIMLVLEENGIEYRVDPDILNDFPEIMKCNVFSNWRTT